METNTLKEELAKLSSEELFDIVEAINGDYPGNNQNLISFIKRSLPFYRDNEVTVSAILCCSPLISLELTNRLRKEKTDKKYMLHQSRVEEIRQQGYYEDTFTEQELVEFCNELLHQSSSTEDRYKALQTEKDTFLTLLEEIMNLQNKLNSKINNI
jgi:hypothetical protein